MIGAGLTTRLTNWARAGWTSWDAPSTHLQLGRLTAIRGQFRIRRTLHRIRSPRRIVATSLAAVFFLIYLLNGIFILSAREPADPDRLRLWLSGGMALYAIYHCVRCLWSSSVIDLELSSAEDLWLGGAPLKRSSVALYHVSNLIVPALLKTLLLAVVLAMDVTHIELLMVGVFTSLMLLEIVRLIIARLCVGLAEKQRGQLRVAASLVAAAIGLQILARLMAITPASSPTWLYILNGFRSLGQTAASDAVQWLSMPWTAGAHVAVTDQYGLLTFLQLGASAAVLPLSILILVHVDARSAARRHCGEQKRLASGKIRTGKPEIEFLRQRRHGRLREIVDRRLPEWSADACAVIARQWVSVRRYQATIAFSFAIPTLLCLSPLATGQQVEQWFFVVGGIALCTLLLAPPALRLDFRRDLRRMLLLRSLPVKPMSMVVGQMALPILITCVFQWITISIAAAVTTPGWSQLMLWTGMLNALAVFTFATENALFLAYPHHERSEGVAMMIRAKLTFLGKATVIAIALGLLVTWAILCRNHLPQPLVETSFVGGAILATWLLAFVALLAATFCWKRFDLACDTPPE